MHTITTEERVKAQLQVEAFIDVFCIRYGIKEAEIPDLLGNLRWLGKQKAAIEGITYKSILTILGLLLTGIALAFWEGFKHLLHR